MSSSDPQHVPDIVSGHAASNQNSVKPKDKSVTPFEPLDQQDGPLSMGPPSRPPRKQKRSRPRSPLETVSKEGMLQQQRETKFDGKTDKNST